MNDVVLDKNGLNAALDYNKDITEERLREIGFTNYNKPVWYYSKQLGNEISFNVSIPVNRTDRLKIDILDDDFLQPFDYQRMLRIDPKHKFAWSIKVKVEDEMQFLQDNGVITGFTKGMHI